MITGKSLRAMRAPQVSMGPRGWMGITWFIRKAGDLTIFAHGGATHGQQAYFFFIPDKDFALAILTNSDDGGIINTEVFNLALDIYFDTKPKLPKPIETPASELKEFTGRYRIPRGGFPMPDTPPGPAMPPMRFSFYEKDKVIGLDEPYKNAIGDFIRDEQGRLQFFRIGSRAHKKIK